MYLITGIIAALATSSLAVPAPLNKRTWSGPYTVTAVAPGHPFHGTEMQAAGSHFYVGPNGSPSTYCPVQEGIVCPNTTDTVMLGGSMDVEVPGGQQMFTQTGGAIAFAEAHSISEPDYLEAAPGPDSYGNFVGAEGEGMAACPVANQNSTWQVFSEVASFNKTGCICFRAIAQAYNGTSIPAWQYV